MTRRSVGHLQVTNAGVPLGEGEEKNRGFGFCEFCDPECAQRACQVRLLFIFQMFMHICIIVWGSCMGERACVGSSVCVSLTI